MAINYNFYYTIIIINNIQLFNTPTENVTLVLYNGWIVG